MPRYCVCMHGELLCIYGRRQTLSAESRRYPIETLVNCSKLGLEQKQLSDGIEVITKLATLYFLVEY